jgi:hypothetical protein
LFLLLVPTSCPFFLFMLVFLNLILKCVLTHTVFVTVHQKTVYYILPRTIYKRQCPVHRLEEIPPSLFQCRYLTTGPCEKTTGKIDAMSWYKSNPFLGGSLQQAV